METLTELSTGLRSGALSPMEYLDRLEARFESTESSVQAFLPEADRFTRLRREARELLARCPDPAARPPLFGVPMGVKDIFHAAGFRTRAGSKLPPAEFEGPEAESVTRLRFAGAMVMGKTVSTEFAYFGPGPTRNPHHLEHTPGGSSSGSAAAVAAGLCPLALGTQTIGSIIRPAAFCGVVGFKPSLGRVSTAGVIPLSPSLDHVGVFAGDVPGVALAASLLCSEWQERPTPDRRPVLGIPEGAYLQRASEQGCEHFRAVVRKLEAAGYSVVPVEAMPDFEEVHRRHNLIVAAEAAKVHAEWFTRYAELYHPKTAELIRRGQSVTDAALAEALEGRKRFRRELMRLMDQHGLDAWISPPALGPAPKGLDSTGDPTMNLPWTYAGLPAINLPAGRPDGLPMGLQVTARFGFDEWLLSWARELESVLNAE